MIADKTGDLAESNKQLINKTVSVKGYHNGYQMDSMPQITIPKEKAENKKTASLSILTSNIGTKLNDIPSVLDDTKTDAKFVTARMKYGINLFNINKCLDTAFDGSIGMIMSDSD